VTQTHYQQNLYFWCPSEQLKPGGTFLKSESIFFACYMKEQTHFKQNPIAFEKN